MSTLPGHHRDDSIEIIDVERGLAVGVAQVGVDEFANALKQVICEAGSVGKGSLGVPRQSRRLEVREVRITRGMVQLPTVVSSSRQP
ncbi:hypothetical protein [Mycolicibacterium sp. YH-1]|uniref:hypothetical protein n=1 Tax=Mycolicibacterium sp. YH-1 TaxID=2908837 RepID=UPI001F4C0086|nr:hypothetical protein [Mycolicibacterium sp. YH-1]UNB52621.1 hypothetical protein L0M16_33095 [Mycolicibacterium sp. YH-1]